MINNVVMVIMGASLLYITVVNNITLEYNILKFKQKLFSGYVPELTSIIII